MTVNLDKNVRLCQRCRHCTKGSGILFVVGHYLIAETIILFSSSNIYIEANHLTVESGSAKCLIHVELGFSGYRIISFKVIRSWNMLE